MTASVRGPAVLALGISQALLALQLLLAGASPLLLAGVVLSLGLAAAWWVTKARAGLYAAAGAGVLPGLALFDQPLGLTGRLLLVGGMVSLIAFVELGDLDHRRRSRGTGPAALRERRRQLLQVLAATGVLTGLAALLPRVTGGLVTPVLATSAEWASGWGVALMALVLALVVLGGARWRLKRAREANQAPGTVPQEGSRSR